MIILVQKHAHDGIDAFTSASKTQNVIRGHPVIGFGNRCTKISRAARFGVAKPEAFKTLPVLVIGKRQKIGNRQAFEVRCGHMVFSGEFPFGKKHLELKVPHNRLVSPLKPASGHWHNRMVSLQKA